jgi:ComF family protein
VDKYKEPLLNLFFPKFCLGCKKEGTYLCDDCRALLDISEFDYCLCETHPTRLLSDPARNASHSDAGGQKSGKCSRCRNKNLSGLYFALSYKEKDLTKKLIRQFKYEPYLKDLAKTLASILVEHFVLSGKNINDIWENGVLVPVPLDKSKLKIRGYNQSEELAKELSKVLQIPVATDVLIKIKSTKPQMELSKEEREKNLQNAFAISSRHCEELATKQSDLLDKKIFLVDDVYTTGSTMNECARVLKENGAKTVWGICIAREG